MARTSLNSTGGRTTPNTTPSRTTIRSLGSDITDSDQESPSQNAILRKDPDTMTEASVAAAEKLQVQFQASNSQAPFHTFIAQSTRMLMDKRMKAMHGRLKTHPELVMDGKLKRIADLTIDEFVKTIRIIYGADTSGQSTSALQQVLKVFYGKTLTHRNYLALEAASILACQISETYALTETVQKDIVSQVLKQARSDHPLTHPWYREAQGILNRILQRSTRDRPISTLEDFTDALLEELCSNQQVMTQAVELGLFEHPKELFVDPNTKKKRALEPEPDTKPSKRRTMDSDSDASEEPKRYSTCFACGREGHVKSRCNFLAQDHPDINTERKPWSESTNGIAWAAKGKKFLPGNMTLSGEPFAFDPKR